MAEIDLERIETNENLKVIIAGAKLGRISGFLAGDISFQGSNNFNDPFTSQAQQSLNALVGKGQGVYSMVTGSEFTAFTAQLLQQSAYAWTGSDRFGFTLPLLFVAKRQSDNTTNQVLSLFKAVYPNATKITSKGSIIQPPLDYLPVANDGQSSRGTMVVTIGTWFQATMLIGKSVQARFSKEPTQNGTPLYAEVHMSFETYRIISYDELTSFFKQTGGVAATTVAGRLNVL